MALTLDSVVALKVYIIGGWFAFLFLMERVAGAATPPKSKARLFRNGALWLLVLLLSPLIVLPMTAFAAEHALWQRQGVFTGWTGLFLDFLILDFWAYWVHRAYHEVPVMWRLHAPHHLDEHLDTTTAVRFHVGEVALSALLRMGPIVLLSIPFAHVVLFETLLLAGAIFHHSNVRLPAGFERALSRVVVTPSIHWVHHHKQRKDTDSNYAAVLSLWDPLFGTRSATQRVRVMKIGVEGLEDRGFFRLLLMPLMGRVR